ncbi:MAG: TolB family protein, partial [Rhodanobacteraceae bacterium]
MKSLRAWWVVALAALLAGASLASAAATPFRLDDLQKLVKVSDPQLAPDGKSVAIVVATPVWKTDKHDAAIEVVDVASGAKRALTRDREDVSSPRWSPDGARLAFLARDPATKQDQVYVMPMDGGDAVRVTDNKQGVDAYAWSPDGKQIAFIAEDPPLHADRIKAHDKVFRVTDGNFLLTKDPAPWQLWVVPATGNGQPARQLTHGDFSLYTVQGG